MPNSPLSTIAHAVRERVVPVVERLHHDEPSTRRDRGDLLGFLRVRGERLLAQHVLAGLERGDGPFGVEPVGERVVDRVELGIGEERGVRVVHLRDAVLGRERVGAAAVSGRYGSDDGFVAIAGGLDRGRRRDAGRAEDADPNWVHGASLLIAGARILTRKGRHAHCDGGLLRASSDPQITRTFCASSPFLPGATSNSTRWPSSRLL